MRQPEPKPSGKKSPACRGKLMFFTVVLVLHLVGAYVVVGRSFIGDYVGQRVGEQMGVGGLARGDQAISQDELEAQMEQTLPTAIAELPRGKLTVSEKRINSYIAANPEALKPLDTVTVSFVPDEVQADIGAFGTSNHATFGLEVASGKVAVVDAHLDGPLGWFISFEDLVQTLEQQINAQFDTQGRAITSIQVQQGAIVAQVE
jgi:hypothetical protein